METLNPPYGSVNRLKYVFDMFYTHNFSQITPSFLRSRGFSGSDAFQTTAALKFLGIIDSEGNRTEKMTKLQLKGAERTQGILEILKSSYEKLFEMVGEPNKLSKDDLHNDFISVYGLSGRLATTAVPNFLWLCKEAGLEVLEGPKIKERKPRTRNFSAPVKSVKTERLGSQTDYSSAIDSSVEVGEFKLVLPKDWDINKTRQAVVKGEFKVIYDELAKLSKKLKKEDKIGGSARVASESTSQVDRG